MSQTELKPQDISLAYSYSLASFEVFLDIRIVGYYSISGSYVNYLEESGLSAKATHREEYGWKGWEDVLFFGVIREMTC